jgi:fatty-acyl-CoA synthase
MYPDKMAGASPERLVSWLADEEETISINYTSGTTGRPTRSSTPTAART